MIPAGAQPNGGTKVATKEMATTSTTSLKLYGICPCVGFTSFLHVVSPSRAVLLADLHRAAAVGLGLAVCTAGSGHRQGMVGLCQRQALLLIACFLSLSLWKFSRPATDPTARVLPAIDGCAAAAAAENSSSVARALASRASISGGGRRRYLPSCREHRP